MQTREEIVKAFTPIEPKFLTQTQKAVLGKLHMAFLDLATTIEMDVPACADRTSALHKLMECKFSCSQAVTHTGYEKKEEKMATTKKPSTKKKSTKLAKTDFSRRTLNTTLYLYVQKENAEFAKKMGKTPKFLSASGYVNTLIAKARGVKPAIGSRGSVKLTEAQK